MILVAPGGTVTFAPEPCEKIMFWLPLVLLYTKYSLSASLGLIVIVLALESVPPNTSTLNCPSDNEPSLVVNVWLVPVKVTAPTPFKARSMMSKFVFVVVPQVPDCAPVTIFSIPVLPVYVLIKHPYAAISFQTVLILGAISPHTFVF